MKLAPGTQFRFLNNPSYPKDEILTVVKCTKNFLDCHTSRFPGVLHCFPYYGGKTPFYGFTVEYLDDATLTMAAANVLANTPIGEVIDFDRTAQEFDVAA